MPQWQSSASVCNADVLFADRIGFCRHAAHHRHTTHSSTSGSLVYAVTQCYMQVQQKIAGADLPTNVVISGGAGVLAAFEGKNIAFETNAVGWRLSSDATAPNQVIPGGIGDFLSVLISQTNDWPKKLLRMPIAPQDARVLRTIDGYQARIVTLRTGPVSPMSEFCVFDLTANRKVYSRVLCSTTMSYGVDSERVVSVSIIEVVLQKEGFIGSPDILAGE